MSRIGGIIVVIGLMAVPFASLAQTSTGYTYDDLGRLKTVSYPSGAKSGYNYDAADNRTKAQTALNGVLSSNSPPACGTQVITITGVPSNVPTITVTGSLSIIPCGDPDGDILSVISPTTAPTFTLTAGQSYSYTITVSDGNGGTANGTLTYHRQ